MAGAQNIARAAVPAVLAAAVALAGCSDRKKNGADADAGDPAADPDMAAEPSDLVDEPRCCTLDTPSCDCVFIGGTRDELGHCEQVCDVDPDGWTLRTDEAGCMYWHLPEDAPSCGGPDIREDEEPPAEPASESGDEPEPAPEPGSDAFTD